MRTGRSWGHFWCLLTSPKPSKASCGLCSCGILESLAIPRLIVCCPRKGIELGCSSRCGRLLSLGVLAVFWLGLRRGWRWRREWGCSRPRGLAEIVWVVARSGRWWGRGRSRRADLFRSGNVIFPLFYGIAEDLVGRLDGLEFGHDLDFMAGVAVRMVLLGCKLSVTS